MNASLASKITDPDNRKIVLAAGFTALAVGVAAYAAARALKFELSSLGEVSEDEYDGSYEGMTGTPPSVI